MAGDTRPRPAAYRLAWSAAALAAAAASAGLLLPGVYGEPASTAAMLRGYDLVTAAAAVPLLAVAAFRGRRGSVSARLAVPSLLAYLVYTYAYHLFGTGFNDLFLLHAAVFATALAALVLALAALDASSAGGRSPSGAADRAAAVILGVLAAAVGAMWVFLAVVNAVTGEVPAGSALVETEAVVHLGMALDLSALVPLYGTAAVLLWRGEAWGRPLAAVALWAGLLHQIGYMVAMPFQVSAEVPGSTGFDPAEPAVALLYAVGGLLVLRGVRGRRAA